MVDIFSGGGRGLLQRITRISNQTVESLGNQLKLISAGCQA